jgi:hypothetical protein
MVRKERLELSRVAPLAPKASASTNSATFACTAKDTAHRYIIENPMAAGGFEAKKNPANGGVLLILEG